MLSNHPSLWTRESASEIEISIDVTLARSAAFTSSIEPEHSARPAVTFRRRDPSQDQATGTR
jgi:hypothetical protein